MDERVARDAIAFDLTVQLNTVQWEIARLLKRVRLGLAAQPPELRNPLTFEDLAFELTMARWDEDAPSEAELCDFRTWILTNGFRELIERKFLIFCLQNV